MRNICDKVSLHGIHLRELIFRIDKSVRQLFRFEIASAVELCLEVALSQLFRRLGYPVDRHSDTPCKVKREDE